MIRSAQTAARGLARTGSAVKDAALLAKLGVGSRRQAAAAARRLGLVPARDGDPGGQEGGNEVAQHR